MTCASERGDCAVSCGSGNRVTGIEIDGSTVEADMVIASGGAREMYFDLVGRENLPE